MAGDNMTRVTHGTGSTVVVRLTRRRTAAKWGLGALENVRTGVEATGERVVNTAIGVVIRLAWSGGRRW